MSRTKLYPCDEAPGETRSWYPRHRPEIEGIEVSELSLGFASVPIAASGNNQLNAEILYCHAFAGQTCCP